MTNEEWRMKHENRMTNTQRRSRSSFRHSSFLRDSSFGLRHSSVHASHSFSLSYSYSCSLVHRSLGEGGCFCFVSRLEFSRKINHKWTRIDTNFVERLPANDPHSLNYGEEGANGREISIKRKTFALICVVRGHIVFTFTLGNARETRDTGTRMNINYSCQFVVYFGESEIRNPNKYMEG